MAEPPPSNICICVEHRCMESRLIDGRPGKVLKNAATLRRHRRDEEDRLRIQATRDMLGEAITRKDEILQSDEEAVIQRLQMLSVDDKARYVLSNCPTRPQEILDRIGRVKDELSALLRRLPRRSSYTGNHANYSVDQTCLELRTCRRQMNEMYRSFQKIPKTHRFDSPSVFALREEVSLEFKEAFSRIEDEKRYWNKIKKSSEVDGVQTVHSQSLALPPNRIVNTDEHYAELLPQYGFIAATIFMVAVCKILLGFSRRGCTWIFDVVSVIVQSSIQQALGVPLNSTWQKVVSHLPKDDRSAVQQLRLEGRYIIYATCPSCHQLHSRDQERWGINGYPSTCGTLLGLRRNHRCKGLLLRSKTIREASIKVPIRPFILFDLKEWVGEILSRPGYEKAMNTFSGDHTPATEEIKDIFHGDFLRNFKGKDKKLFIDPHHQNSTDSRYIFSLGLDFFNPLTNKQAGKRLSVGLLAMTCMSLPPELRYRAENLFLAGIIPSPEPPVAHINNYLRPLVDVLLLFWEGIWFSRTAEFERGRLVLIALVLVVCDLPAARKLLRLGAHNHRCFCSRCWCRLDDCPDEDERPVRYNRADYGRWRLREPDEVRKIAERHRDAVSAKDQEEIFHQYGIRWCELLRLPYFDPVSMVVIDPMHNLFLGLLQEHCRSILNYEPGTEKAKEKARAGGKAFRVEIKETVPEALGEPPDQQFRKHLSKFTKDLEGEVGPDDAARLLKSWKREKMLPCLRYLVRNLVTSVPETLPLRNPLDSATCSTLAEVIVKLIDEKDNEPNWANIVSVDNPESEAQLWRSDLHRVVNHFRKSGWDQLRGQLKDPKSRRDLVKYLGRRRKDALVFLHRALASTSSNYVPEMTTLHLYPEEAETRRSEKEERIRRRREAEELAEILFKWRIQQQQITVPKPGDFGHLTLQEVEEIQRDISKTVKPAWVTPVPSSTHGHGKLKADQWRVFATLHLVISLIRLWSRASERQKDFLDLTAKLVSAVIIATSRVTSPQHADNYLSFMTDYLRGLMHLLPEYKLHPNHHCAMHLRDFLLLFGPVHSWWAFALERMIGGLQRTPTNHKPGEYEETIARTFSQRARLKAFFLRVNVPPSLSLILAPFKRVVSPILRDPLAEDSSDLLRPTLGEEPMAGVLAYPETLNSSKSNWRPLPIEVARAFDVQGLKRPFKVRLITTIAQGGVHYSTRSFHQGNGQVMVDGFPAVIETIMQDDEGQRYAVLRRHRSADISFDPYLQYPVLQARLWNTRLENEVRIVRAEDLMVHFARCDIKWEDKTVAVVVSLSKHWTYTMEPSQDDPFENE